MNKPMHSIHKIFVLVALPFSGIALGLDTLNREMVFQLLKQKAEAIPPSEGKEFAAEWDGQFLRNLQGFDLENARMRAFEHRKNEGVDAIVRTYRKPFEFKTYQTEFFWVFSTHRKNLQGVRIEDWVARIAAPNQIRGWRKESVTGGFEVRRCLPVKVSWSADDLSRQRHERAMWLDTVRTLIDEDQVLLYIEKVYPVRPSVVTHDLYSHRDWFSELRDPRDLTGRRIRVKWWQFWRWRNIEGFRSSQSKTPVKD